MAKYSKFLKMRVSPEDIEIMIKKAETLKISRSDFVRQAIRNSNVYALPSEDIRKFTSELRDINKNIDKIVTRCNKGKLKSRADTFPLQVFLCYKGWHKAAPLL